MDGIINIRVNGYSIVKDSNCAGTQYEENSTKLRIEFGEDWDNFTKTITFWNALGLKPTKVDLLPNLLENKSNERIFIVPIVGEAMTEVGEILFTIDGIDKAYKNEEENGVRKRTAESRLKVLPSRKEANADNSTTPTPTEIEQLQGAITELTGDIAGAVEAKNTAIEKAQEASNSANLSLNYANEAEQHKEDAQEQAERAEDYAERANNAIGKTNYIGENGNWYAWNSEINAFYDTGVKAQSGSTVYYGDNPPDDADVWVCPVGENEYNAPYIGENGNWYEWDSESRCYVDSGVPSTIVMHTHENKTILDGITEEKVSAWNNKVDKELKTSSTTEYKVLSDNNFTDEEKSRIIETVRVWQPNTYYELGDKVIIVDENSWNCFVKNCIETHTSGDTYDSSYWSYDDLYIKEVLYSWESGWSKVADDYTDGGTIATEFSDLQESKSDKTQIGIIEGTEPYIDFINLYNIDVRCTAVDDINSITFEFTDGEYEEDYHAGLTFSTGDTPPQISYTNSGILNWVGTDCSLVDGMSIFTPAANKRYNIVFEFDGERFIGYVSGFTPATANNA